MHEYTVEFRISGAELVPADVTQELGLEPSIVREVGERRSEGQGWAQALWGYNGLFLHRNDGSNPPGSWASLEEGLTFLLDKLEPLRARIDKYREKYEVVFWCGHFQSTFDGGPTFSAKLMRRLGEFGVELYLDNCFAESDLTDETLEH
jgi:Domain of unknown function (DUF4279)